MDYGVVATQKQFVGSMHYEIYTRDFGTQSGTYICTLDNYHQDVDAIDYSTSEQPAEHKSFNLLELDNGQFALYPNNRMRIYDNSLTPETPKVPDFKVSTVYYQVENGHDRDGLGSEDNYYWKTAKERNNDPSGWDLVGEVGVGNTASEFYVTADPSIDGINYGGPQIDGINYTDYPELGWKNYFLYQKIKKGH